MVDAPPALVGDKLLARDRTGEWLAAEVVSERGEANEREVFVAFSGWGPGHNEWIGVSAGKLANLCDEALVHRLDAQVAGYNLQGFHAEEDCWDALCVVDKRIRRKRPEYKVRWAPPYTEADDSWEPPRNVGQDLVAAYEAEHRAPRGKQQKAAKAAKAARKPAAARAPRPPRTPYCHLQLGDDVDAATRRRVAPVGPRKRGLASDIRKHTLRKHKTLLPHIIGRLTHATPAEYVDLRAALCDEARTLVSDMDADDLVTPIEFKSGGQRVVDRFTILSADVTSAWTGAPVWRDGTAEQLMPPLDVDLQTTKATEAEPEPPTTVVVRGRYMRLIAKNFVDGNVDQPTWEYPHKVPENETEEQKGARLLIEQDLRAEMAEALDAASTPIPDALKTWLAELL
jgi:microcompartment protein CcmK/EutM